MKGDVVRSAVEIGGGKFAADDVLRWLADVVRMLRTEDRVQCGRAGEFTKTEESGTVEINPTNRLPRGYSRKILGFKASEALTTVVQRSALLDDLLAALRTDNPVETAFCHALAGELVQSGRATIGNFGTWSVGQKPTLERFVRFRPRPEINRML